MIEQIVHHQFKFLVHGLKLQVENLNSKEELKLMEQYGDGERMNKENLHKMIEQNIHHQFKYLVLHGVK